MMEGSPKSREAGHVPIQLPIEYDNGGLEGVVPATSEIAPPPVDPRIAAKVAELQAAEAGYSIRSNPERPAVDEAPTVVTESTQEVLPHPELSDEQLFEQTVEKLAVAQGAVGGVFAQLETVASGMSEELEQQVNDAIEARLAQLGHEPGAFEYAQIRAETLSVIGNEASKRMAASMLPDIQAQVPEGSRLEREADHLAAKVFSDVKSKFTGKIDWGNFAIRAVSSDDAESLYRAIEIAQDSQARPDDAHLTLQRVKDMNAVCNQAAAQGDALLEGATWEVPEGYTPNKELGKHTREWQLSVHDTLYNYRVADDRRQEVLSILPKQALYTVARVAHMAGMNGSDATDHSSDTISVPDSVAFGLEVAFDHVKKSFYAADRDLLARNGDAVAAPVQLGGDDIAREEYGITDFKKWTDEQLAWFTPDERKELSSISVKPTENWEVMGGTTSDGRNITLYAHPEFLRMSRDAAKLIIHPLTQQPVTHNDALTVSRSELSNTLVHEMTHHVHARRMAVEDLLVWDAIVAQQPDFDASKYVTNVRDAHERGEQRRSSVETEQLAESRAMYHAKPYKLLQASAPRFDFFNQRYGLYAPEEIAAVEQLAEPLRGAPSFETVVNNTLVSKARQKIQAREAAGRGDTEQPR